ncbi:MAG TPA: FAD-binding oxidoreductase [Vicinamibacterales bacterium]|nr:FAD-binding oxidoreductase [Vicinamibacterales bacterium]
MKRYSYWLDTLSPESRSNPEPRPSTSSGRPEPVEGRIPNPDRVDVAIVGGGYTGLAAARRLAIAGASVAVIERGDVGSGASSRNAGQVLTGLKIDAGTLVVKYGERKARELFEVGNEAIAALETLLADEQIECGYERTGHLAAASKPSHFAAMREEQAQLARVFNHPIELLSRADQRAEIGSDLYHGVAIDVASRSINPAQYVYGLAVAVASRGVVIHARTSVTGVHRVGTRWRVSTTAGDIDAGDVLIATNGYADAAVPTVRRRFIPIGSYIIVTEPLSSSETAMILPNRRMAFDSRHFLFYFRLTPDNRLLFGGRAEFSKPSDASTDRAATILRQGLARVFPALADKAIDYVWSGNVAFTRDQMPHAGKLDEMYFAGGYCGHGVAMATHLGDTIARRMAGEPIAHPLMDDRMPAIPFYSGNPWFLPLVGSYYKVLDWLT